MKFLFASELPHLPQKFGGVQSSTHELAQELKQHGHQAVIAAGLFPSDRIGLQTRALAKIIPKRKVYDRILGYPTYRRWIVRDALADIVAETRPDVAVVQPLRQVSLAEELERLSVPTVVYIRDVEWNLLGGDPRNLENSVFVSNSRFTAKSLMERYAIPSTVIIPLFRSAEYQAPRRPENVTFINPHPLKGLGLALEIVSRCPDIPFCFVKSWELNEEEEDAVTRGSRAYGNLTVLPPTRDMAAVYSRAKIVLMPSKWEEAWGRVATEAQFTGIPVIASDRGGLPDSVGPGGLLLDDSIESWVHAVRKLWFDHTYYSELSAAALAHSMRQDLDPAVQVEALLSVARKAIRARAAEQVAGRA